MHQNIFLGDGPFGSRMAASPAIGQIKYPIEWPPYRSSQSFSRPITQALPPSSISRLSPANYRPSPRSAPKPGTFTRPTSQPTAASGSDVHCYYCEGLPEFPTYWMSEAQAEQWNKDRDARCTQVNSSECQKKYGQMRAQQQQANVRRSAFNVINFPSATTYAPTMSGRIPVENPGLIG